MQAESIPIPPERLTPIATEAASNAKTVAAVLCLFLGLFLIWGIGVAVDGGAARTGEAADTGSTIGGIAVWVVVLGTIATRFVRKANRAGAAARAAANHPDAYSFFLSGKLVVVADSAGVPQPDRSFKVSRKLRTMLLAVPRATVVDSNR